ncbi:hypothetical protein GCM10011348_13800 [Marinobacterium nitratireducens]|uniref:Uncharacterized protein n=1 Tax=Marinobacterium nitratireducens TaxID=518897 RepID=A0A917ZA96_9GAMM|nr:hypothetical protein [Marinobacterium nitratireducens]GGO79468.1 hypothetical protein GCM10011348_13800 [Marinobacterium nitratireducens]
MTDDNKEWSGIERRSGEDRRKQPDRREDIRFEPGKKDRRKNKGRRKEDQDPWSKGTV